MGKQTFIRGGGAIHVYGFLQGSAHAFTAIYIDCQKVMILKLLESELKKRNQ